MTHIQTLVNQIHHYYRLPHHTDNKLSAALDAIQAWQRDRIHRANAPLFDHPKTAPLAHYLIDRIYNHATFDTIAEQLLTAGNNALNGSGKLEKLVPKNALSAGLVSVSAAITAMELDLELAKAYLKHFDGQPLDDELMGALYRKVDAKDARVAQIAEVGQVCHTCYQSFNSYFLYKAFKLAKSTAYNNGYQALYDFIHDGLSAIQAIDKIEHFSTPFIETETQIIEKIHAQMPIFD